jgi:DNA polymerase-3 subunit beta
MTGNNMDIGFNPRYFIEALKVIEDENVHMYFTSNIGPSTIRPIDNEDYAYMVLPVRLKSE